MRTLTCRIHILRWRRSIIRNLSSLTQVRIPLRLPDLDWDAAITFVSRCQNLA